MPGSNAIYPTVDQLLTNQYGTRTDPTTAALPGRARGRQCLRRLRQYHRSSPDPHLAGLGHLQLPGRVGAGLTTAAELLRRSLDGRGDSGNLQLHADQRPARRPGPDPDRLLRASPNVGFGKYPFLDIGAYEYVNLHPPEVSAVTATMTGQSDPGQLLLRGQQGGRQPDPADDQHPVHQPDRPQLAQRRSRCCSRPWASAATTPPAR